MKTAKPFGISKRSVWKAWKLVKANRGGAGVDQQTIAEFEADLANNLYRIWNRMSSGSYFPPPVRKVEIPKKQGGVRVLGIPTIADRVAQTVVKLHLEPSLDEIFDQDSYGYRPGKSAKQAVAITRKRCWKYHWVVEFDIKGAFDHIDHDLLMRAVHKHVKLKWAILYLERWLKAPTLSKEGELESRSLGTPQGGVISPLLMNLFMHYAFDVWIRRTHPQCPFARYADDAVVHCRTQREAQELLSGIAMRLEACRLQMHPDKRSTRTEIVLRASCREPARRHANGCAESSRVGICNGRPQLILKNSQDSIIRFLPGGGITMGASTLRRCARSTSSWTRSWHVGLVGNIRHSHVTNAEAFAGSGDLPTESPNCSLTGPSWENQRPDDGSRMTRECHVRFCERLGEEVPPAYSPRNRVLVRCKTS